MTNPQAVREAFWASLDESVALAVPERGAPSLGNGTHFSCYKVPGSGPLPLVVKIAHPHFHADLPEARAEWRRHIARVVNLKHSWIPPMVTREKGDRLYCIMPWCEKGEPVASEQTTAWMLELRRHGFELKDCPQVRWLRGAPVIIDWSDLTICAARTV